eukprot:scaffold328852_cov57-Tisochrysis_lutea.AAC.4
MGTLAHVANTFTQKTARIIDENLALVYEPGCQPRLLYGVPRCPRQNLVVIEDVTGQFVLSPTAFGDPHVDFSATCPTPSKWVLTRCRNMLQLEVGGVQQSFERYLLLCRIALAYCHGDPLPNFLFTYNRAD